MHSDPFPLVPKGGLFFESATHLKAIEFIISSIESNDIFVLVLGDYGSGKTSLCLKLLDLIKKEDIDSIKKIIYVPTPDMPHNMILMSIVKAITQKDFSNSSKEFLKQKIYEYYESNPDETKRIVILLDDVQEYSSDSINEIKWMGNFHTSRGFFPFVFILCGHSSLMDRINSTPFGSFSQKIRKQYVLDSFDLMETKEYIYFRLLNSGAKGFPYFPDDVIAQIHKKSRGIPRQINVICDACLVVGAKLGKKIIDMTVFKRALNFLEMSGSKGGMEEEKKREESKQKVEREIIYHQAKKDEEETQFSQPTIFRETANSLSDDGKINIPFLQQRAESRKRPFSETKKLGKEVRNILKIILYLAIAIFFIGGAILIGDQLKERFWNEKTSYKNNITHPSTKSTQRYFNDRGAESINGEKGNAESWDMQ